MVDSNLTSESRCRAYIQGQLEDIEEAVRPVVEDYRFRQRKATLLRRWARVSATGGWGWGRGGLHSALPAAWKAWRGVGWERAWEAVRGAVLCCVG